MSALEGTDAVHLYVRKLQYEADRLWAMIRYPFQRSRLLARLESALPVLTVETTNICNADCVFCAYQFQTRPRGHMSLELYRKVIADYVECGGGPLCLTPTVGEPLADPHLMERIRYARATPEIKSISLYSNLISLGKVGARELVRSGLSALTVSTSGPDAGMYKRVYRSDAYDKVRANILSLAQVNNDLGRPLDLRVEMRVDRPVSEVTASEGYRAIEALVGADRINVKFRYDSWAGLIKQEHLLGTMRLRRVVSPRISPCSELYGGPMVYWDGKVGGCGCRDVNASELIIGDVATRHLADIWFGPELERLRREFLGPNGKSICRQCTHYNNASQYLTRANAQYLANLVPSRRKRLDEAG